MSASEDRQDRLRPLRSATAYLSLLLIAPVAYHFGLTIAPRASPGPILLLSCFAGAVVLWVFARSSDQWSTVIRVWLTLAVVQWVYLVLREGVGGVQANPVAIFVPLTLLLIWTRRPSREAAWTAADALSWTLVTASSLALLLEVSGLIPSWYEILGDSFLDLAASDRDTHWLAVNMVLGMEGRWGGILRDPNAIGPVGALLAVYGFARPGVRRAVFVSAGVVIVVLSDSRATYGALAFGLLALLLLPGWGVRLLTVTPAKAIAAGLGLLAGARLGSDLVTNPAGTLTLTGRTAMWPDFVSLWPQSPFFGVGTRVIDTAWESGVLPVWSSHAHNQYIDTLVRYGGIGIVLTGALILLGLLVAAAAARRGRGLSVALMVVLIVTMTSNTVLDWRYPSIALSWILVLLVLADTGRVQARA